MKFLVLFGLVALAVAAPQPRKVFHENFEDFLEVIGEEAGEEMEHLFGHYIEFEQFTATMDYLTTENFRDLIYEMESLPEFKAVIEFLENDNIDIVYFLDLFNEMIEQFQSPEKKARHTLSGTTFNDFIKDSIAVFPKESLAALFEQKMEEDEEFRTAIENLNSAEWHKTFGALWANKTFENEVKSLAVNGINLHVLVDEIVAIFGQN